MFFIFSPVNYAAADNASAIATIASEIEYYYSFADEYNKGALKDAQDALDGLTEQDLESIAEPLLESGKVKEYYDENAPGLYSKARWTEFIENLASFMYLPAPEGGLDQAITDFYVVYSDDFKALFGPEITMDDLADLMQATRAQIRPVIGADEAALLANDPNEDMIDKMADFLFDALDAAAAENAVFENKFGELGWTKTELLSSYEALGEAIDSTADDARRSLALMAIRSETDEIGDQNATKGDVLSYTVTIMGEDATNLVGWYSMNEDVVEVTETDQGYDIEAVGPGTTEILVYRDYAGADPEIDWLTRFNVTVASLPGSPGGGGGGGGGVVTPTVTGIAIKAVPDKVAYTEGDELDLSGLKVTLTYSNGTTKDIALADFADNKITVSPKAGDALDAADTEIVITVNGKTIKQAITVEKKTVTPPLEKPVLTDIDGHWAQANIEYLVGIGAIAGYPDETFRPDTLITRAEFARMIVDAFELTAESGKIWEDTANHWAKDYIATAAASGIVLGYNDKEFGPDDLITREQMAIMIVKAAGLKDVAGELSYSDKSDVSIWAYNWVVSATQNKIMSGYTDNTFKPLKNATRAEAAIVIYNVLMK